MGLCLNSNSWGEGIWSPSGVMRYISIRLCKGILFSSNAFLRSNLQVPIALSARQLMVVWRTAVLCDATLFTFCFEPLTDVLGSKISNDSGW